ncbi:MAG TPA: HEAT repeat domain-containing protein, partial [Planctomycetota bacterium]|nr:HEAT repeat domain-containing protein [Planctomycetota bacterium]
TSPAASFPFEYRVGESLTYRYEHSRLVSTKITAFEGLGGEGETPVAPIDFGVHVRGQLHVAVYAEDADGWTLGFRLEKARLELRAEKAERPDDARDLEREMREEILVSVERSGRIRDFTAPATMTAEASNFWRDLLSVFQVDVPADPTKDTWTTTETDMTGEYVATYRRASTSTPASIVKSKTRYARIHGQNSAPDHMRIESTCEIELERVIRSIHGSETLELASDGIDVESSVAYSIELQDARADEAIARRARETIDALRDAPRRTIGSAELAVAEDDNVDPLQSIGSTIDQLIALHRAGGSDSSDEAALMAKIVDLVRRDPRVVTEILDRLQSPEATDELAAVLLGALGAAGTAEAQEGLVAVFASPEWPESRRFTAITALAQVEAPTPFLFDSLEQLRAANGELAGNALLLLGAMGSRVSESDPERYGALRDQILELATSATRAADSDGGGAIVFLEAAKNLRLGTTPELIEAIYRDGDDLLRLEAIGFVEHTFDDRANELLRHALAADSSAGIRAAAAQSLAQAERRVEIELIEEIVATDPSLEVRKAVVTALAERARADERAAEALATIAESNDASEVRELAAAALAAE